MVEFWGIPFNTKKDLYSNFQKHASNFCKAIRITIIDGGHSWLYVLPKSVCATKNNDFPTEYIYSGLICQHALEDIIHVSQRFIKLLHQPAKPHKIIGEFTNSQNGNKESYDYIDDFLSLLKEDIDEPITTRYLRNITDNTTIYDNDEKVFLPHHNSKQQYHAQFCFERRSIVTKKSMTSYNKSTEY